MKKFKYLLLVLLSICIIPVHAADDVSIESVDVLERSNNTEVVNPATFNGLEIKFDIKFVEKNDYIKYKVVVSNNSNKDYKISDTSKFNSSKYIQYDYSFNDGQSTVKAKSKQTMYITITFVDDQIPDSLKNADGTFTETKNMVVNLARGNMFTSNPQTSNTIIALLIVLAIIGITYIVGAKRKNKVTAMLLVFGISVLSLPLTIMAIEEIQIKVNSTVTINPNIEFCVYDKGLTANTLPKRKEVEANTTTAYYPGYNDYMENAYKYKVQKGMTWKEFQNSNYFNQVGNETPFREEAFYEYDDNHSKLWSFFNDISIGNDASLKRVDIDNNRMAVNLTDVIKPCNEAVYYSFLK